MFSEIHMFLFCFFARKLLKILVSILPSFTNPKALQFIVYWFSKPTGHKMSLCIPFIPIFILEWEIVSKLLVLYIPYTSLCTLSRGKTSANGAFYIMHPVSHALSIYHVSVLWKTLDSCKERCHGPARQPRTPACQYMTPSWLCTAQKHQPLPLTFCHCIPCLLKMKIFLSEKAVSPAGQQLCNKGACQVMSDQTNDCWLTLHACRVHWRVESAQRSFEGEGMEIFFYLSKCLF